MKANNKMVVYFYDQRVLLPHKDISGIRSYKFKVEVLKYDMLEHLEFIATLDLKDYVKTVKKKLIGKDKKEYFTTLDKDKIIEEFASDSYNKLCLHLEKRNNILAVQPILSDITNEFLEFDEEGYLVDINTTEYSVYLHNEDDWSYTKTLETVAEVEEELTYLRNMQPLDIELDILNRDYIFTN